MGDLELIKKKILARGEALKIRNSFGSAFKNYRKSNNLTLQEAAENICSVSYLSKVENNLIHISDQYIAEFNKKYQIMFLNDQEFEKYHEWIEDLANILRHYEMPDIKHIKLKSKDHHVTFSKYVSRVMRKQFHQAYDMFEELIDYLDIFTDYEVLVFRYVSAILLNHREKYHFLSEFLAITDIGVLAEHTLNLKIKMTQLYTLMKIRNHRLFTKLYQPIVELLLKHQMFSEIVKIQTFYLEVQAYHLDEDIYKKMLNGHGQISKKEKHRLMAMHYFFNHQYREAKSELEQEDFSTDVLSAMIDERNGIIHHTYEAISTSSAYINKIIIMYLLQVNKGEKATVMFFKKYLHVLHTISDDSFYLDYLYQEAIKIFKANGMYKDAQKITENRNRMLKDML